MQDRHTLSRPLPPDCKYVITRALARDARYGRTAIFASGWRIGHSFEG